MTEKTQNDHTDVEANAAGNVPTTRPQLLADQHELDEDDTPTTENSSSEQPTGDINFTADDDGYFTFDRSTRNVGKRLHSMTNARTHEERLDMLEDDKDD